MKQLSTPVRIGLYFAAAGILLTVVGIVRGNVPLHPANIAVALLIGGGVWFLVAWAVASAAVDVEEDLERGE
ncbi:MAG: hypothetical protein D6790_13695 [Caldilineae bacterium]|nr:MAG: hypothetical protein D6790_13695 [Caldilineae bacterium]